MFNSTRSALLCSSWVDPETLNVLGKCYLERTGACEWRSVKQWLNLKSWPRPEGKGKSGMSVFGEKCLLLAVWFPALSARSGCSEARGRGRGAHDVSCVSAWTPGRWGGTSLPVAWAPFLSPASEDQAARHQWEGHVRRHQENVRRREMRVYRMFQLPAHSLQLGKGR